MIESYNLFKCDICDKEITTPASMPFRWGSYKLTHSDGRIWNLMHVCDECNPENYHESYKKPLRILKKILGIESKG